MAKKEDQIAIENVNKPGQVVNVDSAKYNAMRSVLLKVIPKDGDGLTHKEMAELAKAHLPEDLFPSGAKSMWWSKTVQLDLEAKKVLSRQMTKPLRWVQV